MITVAEAEKQILAAMESFGVEEIELGRARGRVLAERIQADRDFPPFDRATMDGIAVRAKAVERGVRTFPIEGMAPAGEARSALSSDAVCWEIMTGAPVPRGADCVVRIEDVAIKDGAATIADEAELEAGLAIHPQGSDCAAGASLLEEGRLLSAKELAVAASVGKAVVLVSRRPRIAVISTGDELVPVDARPEPHQIRRSNDLALASALAASGYPETTRMHLPDDRKAIDEAVAKLLDAEDVLILAGGISKGKRDYLPDALRDAGVEQIFQGVSQRPGKPLWFGVFRNQGRFVPVFALPGNPVSCFTCLHRYALPALAAAQGLPRAAERFAKLGEDLAFHPKLTLFLPVRIEYTKDGTTIAHPEPFNTSGDFISVASTDGFIELPLERSRFAKGEAFRFVAWW